MNQAATAGTSPTVTADMNHLIERVRALLEDTDRLILGIAGPPGAGKSTLCQALLRAYGDSAAVVGMDGFHLSNEELLRLGRRGRKGAADTFDACGYTALLRRIRHQDETEIIYAPLFDRGAETAVAGAVPIHPDTRLIITEGNYLLLENHGWEQVRGQLDHAWFLELSEQERQRRLVRRREFHGETHQQAQDWVTQVDAVNAVTVDHSRSRADLIITLEESSPPAMGI